jgi:hypothetical protein
LVALRALSGHVESTLPVAIVGGQVAGTSAQLCAAQKHLLCLTMLLFAAPLPVALSLTVLLHAGQVHSMLCCAVLEMDD